jgi:glycosyltransferase involved in cell wall biosynthesis
MTSIPRTNTDTNRKLTVLFVSTRAPFPPTTGHFQRTFNVLKELGKSANVILLAYFDRGLTPAAEKEVYAGLCEVCHRVELFHLPADHSIVRQGILFLRSLLTRAPVVALKYRTRTLRERIRHHIAQRYVDIVHLDMLPLAEYLDEIRGIPVVLTEHNIESLRMQRWADVERNPILRLYLRFQAARLSRYERTVLVRLEHCAATSGFDLKALQSLNPQCHLHLVPNGCDVEYFRPRPRTGGDTPAVIWVGGMNDPYNRRAVEHFAVTIFPLLAIRVPLVRWIVVGRSAPPAVLDLARRYPGQVIVEGFVDDVRPYYAKADVIVVPLLSGSGTKLKVIEGLAMGLPVVTTGVGSEGLEVKPGEDLIVADDPHEFVENTAMLLADAQMRAKLGHNARRIAEREYDWRTIGRKMLDVYAFMQQSR